MSLLKVSALGISYRTPEGLKQVVKGFDLEIKEGEIVALLGPSGSGKSTVALALLGLLPENAVWEGQIRFKGALLEDEEDFRRIRGQGIGIVFQQPHAYLNPIMRVDNILREVLLLKGITKGVQESIDGVLKKVGLPLEVKRKYPFQLSGGMAQRVAIAQTLLLEPALLIGDEITSSLDADLRRGILDLILNLQREGSFAVLFITHDESAVEYLSARRIEIG